MYTAGSLRVEAVQEEDECLAVVVDTKSAISGPSAARSDWVLGGQP